MENAWLGLRDIVQMLNHICMQLFLKQMPGYRNGFQDGWHNILHQLPISEKIYNVTISSQETEHKINLRFFTLTHYSIMYEPWGLSPRIYSRHLIFVKQKVFLAQCKNFILHINISR
jgi:hypothetical protein